MRAFFKTGTASPPLGALFVLATAAGLSLAAACTSGTTANCSGGDGGGPDACGVPAGDAEFPDTTTETGTGDSAAETGAPETGAPETGSPEASSPETGSPEAAADAPKG